MSMLIGNVGNTTTRHMNAAFDKIGNSIERIASGKRKNDDKEEGSTAAALVVANMMLADNAAFQQGVRNANDAVSMIQTADGAMQSISDSASRMKELAMQASNGILSADQRSMIDAEYQQLAAEIDRISESTEFNGIKLLDGSRTGDYDGSTTTSTGSFNIHFGPSNGESDSYNISIGSVSSDSLGLKTSLKTQDSAAGSLEKIDEALANLGEMRGYLGSMENRLGATVSNIEIESENLMASASQITDVDMAKESTALAVSQMLASPATAMYAQANSMHAMQGQLLAS